MGRKKIEVHPGEVYGRLTILKEVEPYVSPSGRKKRRVLAQCSCGSDPIEVVLNHLRSGLTTSCGCVQKEKAKEANKKYNTYDLETYEYGVGYTTKGEEFYFDKEDYQKIKEYAWYLDKDGYVATKDADTKKTIKMHRLVMNASEGKVIDHRHRKTNDNRKSQLREVTSSQNSMNRMVTKRNKSGVVGVSWDKACNKWRAAIGVNGKNIRLGSFTNIEDAIEARLKAELELFGKYSPNYEKLIQQQSDQQSQQNT